MAEQRKLIRLGNSSFAIALPKGWVDKSGLKKGDRVFISHNGHGELMVSPELKKIYGDKEISLEVNDKDENRIRREFTNAYINGNSTFKFIGEIDKQKKKDIQKILSEYISCEIVGVDEKGLLVKDFFNS